MKQPRYYIGCSTLHILGRHYAAVFLAGRCVFEFEYGKDYMSAVDFVRESNRCGELYAPCHCGHAGCVVNCKGEA